MSESTDMQRIQHGIVEGAMADMAKRIRRLEKRISMRDLNLSRFKQLQGQSKRVIGALNDDNERLVRINLELRNCMNCVSSPFEGIRCRHHCGEWLRNECSDRPDSELYLVKWRNGVSK